MINLLAAICCLKWRWLEARIARSDKVEAATATGEPGVEQVCRWSWLLKPFARRTVEVVRRGVTKVESARAPWLEVRKDFSQL